MKSESIALERALSIVSQLSPLEKVRLIEKMIPDLEASLVPIPKPRRLSAPIDRGKLRVSKSGFGDGL
jgi:hypothetical protein